MFPGTNILRDAEVKCPAEGSGIFGRHFLDASSRYEKFLLFRDGIAVRRQPSHGHRTRHFASAATGHASASYLRPCAFARVRVSPSRCSTRTSWRPSIGTRRICEASCKSVLHRQATAASTWPIDMLRPAYISEAQSLFVSVRASIECCGENIAPGIRRAFLRKVRYTHSQPAGLRMNTESMCRRKPELLLPALSRKRVCIVSISALQVLLP